MNFSRTILCLVTFTFQACGESSLTGHSGEFPSFNFVFANAAASTRVLFVDGMNGYSVLSTQSLKIRHVVSCTPKDAGTSSRNVQLMKITDEAGKVLNTFSVRHVNKGSCAHGVFDVSCTDSDCVMSTKNPSIEIKKS